MISHDAEESMFRILDGEASPDEIGDFNRRMTSDPELAARFRFEQAMHKKIHQVSLPAQPATAELKSRIMRALDAEEAGTNTTVAAKPVPVTPLWSKLLSAAAVLTLVIGAGVIGQQLYVHNQRFMPLEEAHWQAASAIGKVGTAQVASAELFVTDSLRYQLFPAAAGMTLTSGSLDTLMGVLMGHFVFTDDKRVVSVFVTSAESFSIPADLQENRIDRHGLSLFDHNCRGCRLVYHTTGKVVVITAESERTVDLLEFVPGSSLI